MRSIVSKYSSLSVVARAAMWFLFCSILQKSISFISVPIFTRLMSQEQYGLYNSYLSVASVVTVICTLNLESCGFINGITKLPAERHDDLAINLLTLSSVVTVVIASVYFALHSFINYYLGVTTPMMALMFIEIFFIPAVRFWSYKQRFSFKYVRLVVVTVCITVLNATLGILLTILAKPENQAVSRIISTASVQMIFGLTFYISFAAKSGKIFIKDDWYGILKTHIPLLPHNLSMSLLYTADRIMINMFCGPVETAIYSVSYSAGMVVQTLKTSIVDAVRPWIYEKIKVKNYEEINHKVTLLMIFVALISFAFSLFAPEIVAILAPAEYSEAVYVIPSVAGSSFFMFLYNLFVAVETYYEKTKMIMIASVAAAVLNILLNWLLIPRLGYIVAGYTTLVSYVVLTILHYRNVLIIEKKHLGGEHIFDIKRILVISVLTIIIIILITFIFKTTFVRIGVIAALFISIIIFRRNALSIIKMLLRKTSS